MGHFVLNMKKINIENGFDQIVEHWSPKIASELNGQHVKLAKLHGEFVWHKHDHEDELFLVFKGQLTIEFREKSVILEEGEMITIPKGVEHKPVAKEEVHVLLFEPKSTVNTGNSDSDYTKIDLDWIQ